MYASQTAYLPEYVTVKTFSATCINEQRVVYTICAAVCMFLGFNNAISVHSNWLCSIEAF